MYHCTDIYVSVHGKIWSIVRFYCIPRGNYTNLHLRDILRYTSTALIYSTYLSIFVQTKFKLFWRNRWLFTEMLQNLPFAMPLHSENQFHDFYHTGADQQFKQYHRTDSNIGTCSLIHTGIWFWCSSSFSHPGPRSLLSLPYLLFSQLFPFLLCCLTNWTRISSPIFRFNGIGTSAVVTGLCRSLSLAR